MSKILKLNYLFLRKIQIKYGSFIHVKSWNLYIDISIAGIRYRYARATNKSLTHRTYVTTSDAIKITF